MRILHIVTGMDPEGGGPQEAVRMLLAYSPPGVSNEIATVDDPGLPFLKNSPLPIHALGAAGGGWYSRRLAPWLRVHRKRFDGVLHHGLWGYTSVATLHAIAGHLPYMVFPHGMLDPYFKRAFPAKHLKKWPFWLGNEYWLLRRADRVLFTADSERDRAAESFPVWRWTPMVVPLGTEPPPIAPAEARGEFLARFPELREKRFLLFLGRIHPKKGCDLLIRAFAAVQSRDPGLHLVMAGPDSVGWRAALEGMAAKAGVSGRVHWPGMLHGPLKWGALAACEAFVLPSHQENFGISVVEALACARPVLISSAINISADLAAAGCAYVEPDTLPGVQALLARWMATLVHDRETMGRRAVVEFARSYDMRRNAGTILQAFASRTVAADATSPAEVH